LAGNLKVVLNNAENRSVVPALEGGALAPLYRLRAFTRRFNKAAPGRRTPKLEHHYGFLRYSKRPLDFRPNGSTIGLNSTAQTTEILK
jgi:hypothetical protein